MIFFYLLQISYLTDRGKHAFLHEYSKAKAMSVHPADLPDNVHVCVQVMLDLSEARVELLVPVLLFEASPITSKDMN